MYDPNHFKHLFTLNSCFYKLYISGHQFRDVEIEAVIKVLSCKTERLGKLTYCCANPNCEHVKYVLTTCKNKMCQSCGQKATERWIAAQSEILPDCKFRHITFTMPDVFWPIFELNRWLLGALFSIAARSLLQQAKNKKLTIGIFSALHTYGRQLNFNCHIHLSLAELALNMHGYLKKFSFKFASLMRQWRYEIIKLLRDNYEQLILPPELVDKCTDIVSWNNFLDAQYNRHWNVNIAKKTSHKKHTSRYFGSYIKKPPIAASKLKEYIDGGVIFTYLDHNSKKYKDLTLSQEDMMLRVLSHVPEKNFKMIRYYGFLSTRKRGELLPWIYKKLGQEMAEPKNFSFAAMMKSFLKVDPFECILCGSRMVFTGFTAGLKLGQLANAIKNVTLQRPVSRRY